MEDKNYKGLIWLVVILIILVVAMMGFIVYKELNDEEKPCNINTTNTTTKEEDKKLIKDVKDFPEKSDESVLLSLPIDDLLKDEDGNDLVDYKENFQNVKYQINNIKYSISCDEFGDNDAGGGNFCIHEKIKFDDYTVELAVHAGQIIITKDYVISQPSWSGMPGGIYIYDKNGEFVFGEGYGIEKYHDIDDDSDHDVKIAVVNNILYYVTHYDYGNKLYFSSLDLSNLNKIQIQEFEGIPCGMVY